MMPADKLIIPYQSADTNQEAVLIEANGFFASTVIVIVNDIIPIVIVLFCY